MKRLLAPDALHALARGCAVLGAGGGGDTYLTLLQALQATEDYGPVALVNVDELPDDALIMPCGGIGAPTVSIEKIENGDEGDRLRDHLQFLTGRTVAALMASEIGGGNGVLPVTWAARMGLPVVDADGMGRAFPEVPQVAMQLAGISPSPAVMTDERGNLVLFQAISGHWIERLERAAAVEFGGAASSTEFTLTAAQARTATVRNSVSLAIRIGSAVLDATGSPVNALIAEIGAFRLVGGKVADVERHTTSGFVRGSVVIEGLGADAPAHPAGVAEREPGRAAAGPCARLGARPDLGAGQRDRGRHRDRAGQVRPAGGGDRVRLRPGLADRARPRAHWPAGVRL